MKRIIYLIVPMALYSAAAFAEWSFNPGDWDSMSRIMVAAVSTFAVAMLAAHLEAV